MRAAARARASLEPQLRRVINATGVVLHTNLGRAPLAESARLAVNDIARGYSSLELRPLDRPARQSRHGRGALAHQADRSRGGAGGQQRRGRGAARALGARGRALGGGFARRAGRDRRIVPDSRDSGEERREAAGSRHHEPHARARLSARARKGRRRGDPARAPQQFPAGRLHHAAAARGPGRDRAPEARAVDRGSGQRRAGGPGRLRARTRADRGREPRGRRGRGDVLGRQAARRLSGRPDRRQAPRDRAHRGRSAGARAPARQAGAGRARGHAASCSPIPSAPGTRSRRSGC